MNTYTLVGIVIAWLIIAFFSGIEVAFTSANKLAIELKKKQGLSSGIILSHFMDHPVQFLGTTLIGFNIGLVLFGLMVGETFLPFWIWLVNKVHMPEGWVNFIRLCAETFMASVILLFFGEFIPRAIFRSKSDAMLSFFSGAMDFFSRLLYPIAGIFIGISQWVLKYVFNVRIDERKGALSSTNIDHLTQQMGDAEEDNQDL
ncbi:MAG TPA: DUF21 domain-containing protein, partial [Puia sp.]|nr:DUF21 domain-containing protein [Puia sp.]